MKKIYNNKKILLCIEFLFCALFAFSQEKTEEEIMLPEVSTVISGGAPKAGKSAVPDFSKILPQYEEEKNLPDFPDEVSQNQSEEFDISNNSSSPVKNIYAEGIAGAGYPGFFTGNFSIYRQSGNSPFLIKFFHESVDGYAGKPLTSGYFDRSTGIQASKKIVSQKHVFDISGKYESTSNGLQNKFENISDVSKNLVDFNLKWDWKISNNFFLSIDGKGNWYRRFATVTGTPFVPIEDSFEDVSVLDVFPKLELGWNHLGFWTNIGAGWTCSHDITDSFIGKQTVQRGNFFVDLGWHNSFSKIYANASAVIGNEIGSNDVIVPWKLGADFNFISKLSSRKMKISFAGGIESELPKVFELENNFVFSALHVLPAESTSWFGKLSLSIPVKDVISFGFDGKFSKTAYGNDKWQADYDGKVLFGQYLYQHEEMMNVNTNVYFSIKAGPATFSAQWNSYWGDVPSAKKSQFVSTGISISDRNSKFIFDGKVGFAPDPDDDNCPEIDLSASFKITQVVRLAVSANDIVKLVSGETRTYEGQYIQRSGYCGLLVKFFF